MQTITKNLDIEIDIKKISKDIDINKVVFFDIETTGLSAFKEQIYLIGVIYYDTTWKFTQFFSETGLPEDEKKLLENFFELSSSKDTFISFNGDSFDIRFILKRAEILKIENNFSEITSIDLYKFIKKYKSTLGLENCKLKTVEKFLGIHREDKFTGGELISFYIDYTIRPDENLKKIILLHNEEDLYGLVNITDIIDIINYINILKLTKFEMFDLNIDYNKQNLNFKIKIDKISNFTFNLIKNSWVCKISKNSDILKISINIKQGTLYHYFENYKDYYYVEKIDEAIHKSMISFFDKNEIAKAKKSNAYTKKEGYFLEIFNKFDENLFFEPNKKDIYFPIKIGNYKYLSESILNNAVISFFQSL